MAIKHVFSSAKYGGWKIEERNRGRKFEIKEEAQEITKFTDSLRREELCWWGENLWLNMMLGNLDPQFYLLRVLPILSQAIN